MKSFSLFTRNKHDEADKFSSMKVFSITDHSKLLNTPLRRKLVAKIKKLSRAPDQYFQSLYLPLIQYLADYLQSLPDLRTHGTSHASYWLDSALARTAYAMTLRHRITLPHLGTPDEVEKDYALWTYVTFSSSLLWQIGKLSTHYMVSLCDEKGCVTGHWNPMRSSLAQAGEHYKIRSLDANGPATFKQMTTVLAKQLLPKDGFSWIASNAKALEEWLLALTEETGSQGSLVCLLELSQKIILERAKELAELELFQDKLDKDLEALEKELQDIREIEKAIQEGRDLPPVAITEPPDTKLGEEFFRWLKKGLADRSIPYNKDGAKVHVSPDGVVLAYPALFEDFCSMFYRNQNWVIVYKQFNYLGLHKKSGYDTWFGKFFLDSDKLDLAGSAVGITRRKSFTGMLLQHPQSLFSAKDMPSNNPNLSQAKGPNAGLKQQPEYPNLSGKRGMGMSDKK